MEARHRHAGGNARARVADSRPDRRLAQGLIQFTTAATRRLSTSPWVNGPRRGTAKPWSAAVMATTSTPANSSGRPKASRSPCTTSKGTRTASSPALLRSGRPDGWRGKPNASTPAAAVAAAQRHATRAPALRPPTTRGTPGTALTAARTAGSQAASSSAGAGAIRRPATHHGCSTRTTVIPCDGSPTASAARSRAATPPPAPWPSTTRARGRPSAASTWSRAGPWSVGTWCVVVTGRRRRPATGRSAPVRCVGRR